MHITFVHFVHIVNVHKWRLPIYFIVIPYSSLPSRWHCRPHSRPQRTCIMSLISSDPRHVRKGYLNVNFLSTPLPKDLGGKTLSLGKNWRGTDRPLCHVLLILILRHALNLYQYFKNNIQTTCKKLALSFRIGLIDCILDWEKLPAPVLDPFSLFSLFSYNDGLILSNFPVPNWAAMQPWDMGSLLKWGVGTNV